MSALASSLLWTALTVASWLAVSWISARMGSPAWASPVLWTSVLLAAAVLAGLVDDGAYARATEPLTDLLAPAVVALAVPVRRAGRSLGRVWLGVAVTAVLVSALGVLLGVAGARLLHLDGALVDALAPKHATSPVAALSAAEVGGDPALAAALAVTTGVLCAVLGPPVLDLLGVRDPRRRGLVLGLTGHAIGTSRAMAESPLSGAFAAAGMALAAALVPVAVWAVLVLPGLPSGPGTP